MSEEPKTRDQEERYHAMLGDVAKQCMHLNRNLGLDDWKRLCVDQFRRDSQQPGGDPRVAEYWRRNGMQLIPGLDGTSLVLLGSQTRKFPKYVATAFIDWLHAFGAEREVRWSDPTTPPIEAYSEAA